MGLLVVSQTGKDPLARLVKTSLEETDGKIDKAVQIATGHLLRGLRSPHAEAVEKLVREALRARMAAEHGIDRAVFIHNAIDPTNPVSRSRRAVAVPNRRSNAALQAEIEDTLNMRISGDIKLCDATRNDLFRSAELDEKVSTTRLTNARWKRSLGRKLAVGKTVGECGITGIEVRKLIREAGARLEEAA